jgi:hypothetical protein
MPAGAAALLLAEAQPQPGQALTLKSLNVEPRKDESTNSTSCRIQQLLLHI